MITLDLPEPSAAEKKHSQILQQRIQQKIQQAEGWISFDDYMEMALYEPGLGYYSAGLQKFGEQGDFITSPEISPLFAQCLSHPVASSLQAMSENAEPVYVLEFGAGSGKLAADLLLTLQQQNQLPEQYMIVELSAELQQRQYQTIKQNAPDLIDKVVWLSALPETPINAVVIANEVLDAMPVKRFSLHNKTVSELGVSFENNELVMRSQTACDELVNVVEQLNIESISDEYISEVNFNIHAWIKSLSACLQKAAIYIVDYGYAQHEYYSTERHMGTLIGYYRHRAVDAPLWYPGLQDITAFVDFTCVAEAAIENGFDVDGYTSQGNFLINCGLAEIVEKTQSKNDTKRLQLIQQMKTLSLPGEMGERFKVIGLSKGMTKNIAGFEQRDLRYAL